MTTRPHLGERPSHAYAHAGFAPQTIADRDPERARRLTQGLTRDLRPFECQPVPALSKAVAETKPVPPPAMPTNAAPTRSGYRRNAIFHGHGTFDWRILDRNQRAKLWSVAQSMERITKQKGDRNGCLGAIGLTVLNCLLYRFLNAHSGRCDPSYNTLQKLTGLCRQSISTAIDRLEASGLVTVTRRMMRFKERVRCALTGRHHEIVVVRQISNAYVLTDPACIAIPARAPGKPARRFPMRRDLSVFAAALAGVFDKFTGAGFSGTGQFLDKPSLSGRGKLKQTIQHPLATQHKIYPR